ncbi:alpha/beta hydrolase [Catellatospora chokoriensis]|uniref:Acetylesterase n=1 Tax=Catellatospora chokoriensis TaxID=310353 RepID=A0A8J3JVP0_9ACTN|nr:alpha/beta hydrolase [Catellatospora chokoriensis]GIF91952.1 acetylesterase [Catellatospora chokoriensis]
MGLDEGTFVQTEYAPDVVAFNARLGALVREMGWPPQSAQAFRAQARERLADLSPGGVLPRSPLAREITVPLADGSMRARVFDAPAPTGLFLHVHGGGWVVGAADEQDAYLEDLVRGTGQTVVSLDYPLAPERRFPGMLDDCEAAARHLLDHASQQFGVTAATLGGESSGANLALAVALRLGERPAAVALRALNLCYGVYDLSLTPSARDWDDARGGILTTARMRWYAEQYVPDLADRLDPAASPLYARLTGLPPALLTVGTEDPLLDDTLFLYARLLAARSPAQVQVVPGAGHSFNMMPLSVSGPANAAVHRFLAAALTS